MAVYEWIIKTDQDDLYDAVAKKLKDTNFKVEKSGTTEMQISAVYTPKEIVRYWSGVRMLATWLNFNARTIKIEVRSDEPMLRANTHCERSAKELMKLLPPLFK